MLLSPEPEREEVVQPVAADVPQSENQSLLSDVPKQAERLRMSDRERLQLLEDLGCVPDDPHLSDYALAEKTTWWGRRLDPQSFWSNRVAWLDRATEFEARRRGRGYPPIPYEDASVADRSDKDERGKGFRQIHYVHSSREHAFWDQFVKTHPLPPEKIEGEQRECASSVLRTQHIMATDSNYAARLRLTPEKVEEDRQWSARQAQNLGFPVEAFDKDALLWSHVIQKREEYSELLDRKTEDNTRAVSNFFRRVYVDRKYITEPLSDEDIATVNAWKVSYLKRLRAEGTDESYINAYLAAWNLDESALTAEGQ